MSPTEATIAELPTIWRPEAVRSGLTTSMTFSENTGVALAVFFDGIDEDGRPIHLRLNAATVVRLAEYCKRTLPEDER